MPRSELKQNIRFKSTTTPSNSHPSGTCIVPTGFTAIGGGARSNYTGYGQLLTASFPQNATTWRGEAKDHRVLDPATLTVYCIGIRSTITGVGSLQVERLTVADFVNTGVGTAQSGLSTGFVPGCYGGRAHFDGQGRLLFRMSPTNNSLLGFTAASKDHRVQDSGGTEAWVTQVRL